VKFLLKLSLFVITEKDYVWSNMYKMSTVCGNADTVALIKELSQTAPALDIQTKPWKISVKVARFVPF